MNKIQLSFFLFLVEAVFFMGSRFWLLAVKAETSYEPLQNRDNNVPTSKAYGTMRFE